MLLIEIWYWLQFCSSDLSLHSLSPSQTNRASIQRPVLAHWNESEGHVRPSKYKNTRSAFRQPANETSNDTTLCNSCCLLGFDLFHVDLGFRPDHLVDPKLFMFCLTILLPSTIHIAMLCYRNVSQIIKMFHAVDSKWSHGQLTDYVCQQDYWQ